MLPQKTDDKVDWGNFQLGYHLGMAAVLVSTHVYIYVYMCVCMFVYIHIYTHTDMYT